MPNFAPQQMRTQNSHLVRVAKTDRAALRPAQTQHPMLSQQTALGNQAMQRMLHTGVIQAKLTINEPGDQYEQEADRVAEQVMRMPDPGITDRAAAGRQTPSVHIQRMCPECEEKLHRQTQVSNIQRMCPTCKKEEETLHAKEVAGQTPAVTSAVQAQVNALRSGGQPLPPPVRAFLEPRFGHDFSQVRIHTDVQAAESARSVNALAYTVGRNVVFGAGQYAPETTAGKRLLAHELSHVLQQSAYSVTGDSVRVQRLAGTEEVAGQLLTIGMVGPAVASVQRALNLLGHGMLVEDGIFGPLTRDAVVDFQTVRGLDADGVVGPQTKQALLAAAEGPQAAAGAETRPAAIVGGPALTGLNDTCVYLPGEKDRTAADAGGGNVSSLVAGAEPDRFGIFGFTQGSAALKPLHLEFLQQMVERFKLAGDNPDRRVRLIEGFSDCVDAFAKNVSIRRSRALATKLALLDLSVRSTNLGDAVASQVVLDQRQVSSDPAEAEEGRRQNRAAVCHLELVDIPLEEPSPDIPDQDPSCDRIHDKFLIDVAGSFTAKIPLRRLPFGAGLVGFGVVNCKTRCIHPAHFTGGGFSIGLVGIELQQTAPSVAVVAKEPVHTEELTAPAKLTLTRLGPPGLNVVRAKVEITGGPIAGTVIDLGNVKLVGGFKMVAGRVELVGRFTVEGPFPSEVGGVKIVFPPSATDCPHDPTQ